MYEVDAAGSDELSRWIAYFTHVEPRPDLYTATAIGAHASRLAAWCGEGRRPEFEDFHYRYEPEETLEETAARLVAGLGAVKADGESSPGA